MNAFSIAFMRGMPHGVIAAIHLPEPNGTIPTAALRRLHSEEREYAVDLGGHREVQWIGGRLAARQAARALGKDIGPLMIDGRGAPIAPEGLSISISHKGNLAVAIASRKQHGSVGIDLEHIGRDRRQIAEKVLRPAELTFVQGLPDDRQWGAILVRFALKEATYKALAPQLQRYIGFHEAEIERVKDGSAQLTLHLESEDAPSDVEAHYQWMPEGLVATVRARWD